MSNETPAHDEAQVLLLPLPGPDGARSGWLQCPGCDDLHRIVLDGPGAWIWDGDTSAPTITPSILVTGGSREVVCHSLVTRGKWQFLPDSTHALAGQTVPMDPVVPPRWITPQAQPLPSMDPEET